LKIEDDRKRRNELEAYLDKGRGACHLRRPEVAALVEDAIRLFHGARYDLLGWAVMSNHVHALFNVDSVPMATILESWKKHTSSRANRLLSRRGPFWAPDYLDIYMRNEEHQRKTIRYIENNPTKGKLALDPKAWPWSSARFRDAYGRLCI
jgi:REP element-mobilizing transposase RayT